ncbi:MAG: hypothetical protein ABIN61_00510 [candidate division WOR-3 bacterium]
MKKEKRNLKPLGVKVIDYLVDKFPSWIEKLGPYSDMILFSKVSLYRNLGGYKFNFKNSEKEKEEILELLREGFSALPLFENIIFLRELNNNERQFLMEREFISKDCLKNFHFVGLGLDASQEKICVLNGKEHVEISCFCPELLVRDAYTECDRLDDELNEEFGFAYDEELGFLTSSIEKLGTGMIVSSVVHLPALVITGEIVEVIEDIEDSLFHIEGIFNIEENVAGSYFRISNRFTLGISEEEILDLFEGKIKDVIKEEVASREYLTQKAGYETEDKICRSYGILENARMLSINEFLNLSSAVRLGLSLGIIKDINIKELNKWILQALPGYIRVLNPEINDIKEENIVRAKLIRSNLGGEKCS